METLSNINDRLVSPFGLLPVALGMGLAALIITREWWRRPPAIRLPDSVFFVTLGIASLWLTLTFVFLLSKTAHWGGSDGYFTRAVNMAEYGVFGEGYTRTAFFPPGYSFLLFPLILLMGATRWAFFIVNIALLLLATLAFRRFLRRLELPGGLANGLALLLFLYPNRLLSTLLPFSDVPFSLFWAAAFACLVLATVEERPFPFIAALGVLAGTAALIRSNGVLLLLPLAAGLLLRGRLSWKAKTQQLALFAGIVLLVIAPWLVRNHALFGKVIPVSTNGGLNLTLGNNPTNPIGWNPYVDSVWHSPDAWKGVGGTEWNEAQQDSFYTALASRYIADHPDVFLSSGLRRVGRTFGADSYAFGMLETYTNARLVTFQVFSHPAATPLSSRIVHMLYRGMYSLLLVANGVVYYCLITLALYLLIFRRTLPSSITWSFFLTAFLVCATVFATMGLSRYKEPLGAVMLVFLAAHISHASSPPRLLRNPR